MAKHKVVFQPLVLLLALSLVFSNTVAAAPWSRSLKEISSASLSAQDFQDQMAQGGYRVEQESFVEGRMDAETSDYSGTGANKRHDPTPPGSG